MSRLLLIPALIALASAAIAEQPRDGARPPAMTIGPFELSADRVEVKARQTRENAERIPEFNGILHGDASIRYGDSVVRADEIVVTTDVAADQKEHLMLQLRGNCSLRMDDLHAAGDQIRLEVRDHLLLLSSEAGRVRLTYGDGEKATSIEASSIRFDVKTRQVQATGDTRVQLGR